MEIRLAKRQDCDGILKLLLQVGQVHHQIRPDIFRAGCLKYDTSQLLTLLKDESCPIFVAVEENAVLGYCFCRHRDYENGGVSTCRKEIYIDDLCVDEGHRGKGIATRLYRHAVEYATDRGCQFVTLNVWCGNDSAIAFYEKMGMTPRNITMEVVLGD